MEIVKKQGFSGRWGHLPFVRSILQLVETVPLSSHRLLTVLEFWILLPSPDATSSPSDSLRFASSPPLSASGGVDCFRLVRGLGSLHIRSVLRRVRSLAYALLPSESLPSVFFLEIPLFFSFVPPGSFLWRFVCRDLPVAAPPEKTPGSVFGPVRLESMG